MVFDISICAILLIFFLIGYNKGIVSMVLAIGLSAAAFLFSFYFSSKIVVVSFVPDTIPYGNVVVQALLLFVILSAISTYLIKKIDFEELVVVGGISRILGGLFYVVIASVLILAVVTSTIFFRIDISTYTENSICYQFIYQVIEKLIISKLSLNSL